MLCSANDVESRESLTVKVKLCWAINWQSDRTQREVKVTLRVDCVNGAHSETPEIIHSLMLSSRTVTIITRSTNAATTIARVVIF